MKTPDGIHALAYELHNLTGGTPRRGKASIRVTLSPLPIDAEDAHERCYSIDLDGDGVDRVTQALRDGSTQADTRTEAA